MEKPRKTYINHFFTFPLNERRPIAIDEETGMTELGMESNIFRFPRSVANVSSHLK